jgi:hypothetical protein
MALADDVRVQAERNVERLRKAMPALGAGLHFTWREDRQRFTADRSGLRVAVGWSEFELFMFDVHGALRWDAQFSARTPASLVASLITTALEQSLAESQGGG